MTVPVRCFIDYTKYGGVQVRFCGGCGQCVGDEYGHGMFQKEFTPDDLMRESERLESHNTLVRTHYAKKAAEWKDGKIGVDEYVKSGENLPPDPHWGDRDARAYHHYAYCPWCGAQFDDEWWLCSNTIIENERPVDHYSNPGHHKGDTHVFSGTGPDCMNHHYLSTTGDEICWCGAEVVPDLLGCEIRHTDADYETVMAERRVLYEAEQAISEDDDDDWDDV